MNEGEQRYFVARLDNRDFRPVPAAAFVVEVLPRSGPAEVFVYFAHDSEEVVAVLHARLGLQPKESQEVPQAVIRAARERAFGDGQYVNARGEIIQPLFLPPQ